MAMCAPQYAQRSSGGASAWTPGPSVCVASVIVGSLGPAAKRRSARRTEVVLASVHGATSLAGAPNSGLAQFAQPFLVAEGPLERPELQVDLRGALHLRVDEIRPRAPEAMQLDHESTDVTQLNLAQPAQVPSAAANPAALGEARIRGLVEPSRGDVVGL